MKLSHLLYYAAKKSSSLVKRHLPVALGTAGAICVGITVYEAIKETPEAEKVKDALPEDIGAVDYIRNVAPCYKGTITMSGITVGLIFGSTILSHKRQASLLASYTMLDRAYRQYKDKVVELLGDDTHTEILTRISEDELATEHPIAEEDEVLYYDSISHRYFTDTPAHVSDCEYQLLRKFLIKGILEENEWYWLLDNDELPPLDTDDIRGWSMYQMELDSTSTVIDIEHHKVRLEDGLEYIIIDFKTPPISDYMFY